MTKGKRLAALEQAAEQARAARVAARDGQLQRALSRLSRDELDTLRELDEAPDELLEAVNEATLPYRLDPEQYAALFAWTDALDKQPDDEPLLTAPAGAVAQFEAWAALCSDVLKRDDLDELLTLGTRWGRAMWRWDAELAREAGEM